jgi:hypothetical protein
LKRDQQIAELLRHIQEMEEEIKDLKDLKELLKQKGASKGSKKPKLKLNYSRPVAL